MDDSIKYATNAEKTSAEVLEGKIEYALNREKTEKQIYETALNCFSASTAYSEMQRTKEKWHKTGGVLGYHFIQSFKPKEATPETVHEIGVEFARRCFGERFEVVIGTHLDRNHLHNHIVVNSVSFADGKKYHSNAKSYFVDIRKISDEICREYGLSVIEPQKKGIPYGVLHAEKNGKQTVRSQIRADIDEVIEVSLNFTVFLELLKKINKQFGITIVIITHQMSVVREICTHVAIMYEGEVVEKGLVADIFANPQSEVAKELIRKDTGSDIDADSRLDAGREKGQAEIKSGEKIRIVFSENSAFEPVIANLILTFGEPVNILKADTKNVGGVAKGEMILEFMEGSTRTEMMKQYLKEKGLAIGEVIEYVGS